jgi:hypothetical protein
MKKIIVCLVSVLFAAGVLFASAGASDAMGKCGSVYKHVDYEGAEQMFDTTGEWDLDSDMAGQLSSARVARGYRMLITDSDGNTYAFTGNNPNFGNLNDIGVKVVIEKM